MHQAKEIAFPDAGSHSTIPDSLNEPQRQRKVGISLPSLCLTISGNSTVFPDKPVLRLSDSDWNLHQSSSGTQAFKFQLWFSHVPGSQMTSFSISQPHS